MQRKPIIGPDPSLETWVWSNGKESIISILDEVSTLQAILHCYIKMYNNSQSFHKFNVRQKDYKPNSNGYIRCMKKMQALFDESQQYYNKLEALRIHCDEINIRYPKSFDECKSQLNAKKKRHRAEVQQR